MLVAASPSYERPRLHEEREQRCSLRPADFTVPILSSRSDLILVQEKYDGYESTAF